MNSTTEINLKTETDKFLEKCQNDLPKSWLKKQTIQKIEEPSYTVGGDVNWCNHHGGTTRENSREVPLNIKSRVTI